MKRYLMLLMAVVAVALVSAQTIKQAGVAYRYNGKDQRTPLGGVHIKVAAANGVLSKSDGSFSLLLNSLQMGSRIGNVKVTKGGMMIFNKDAVDEWSVRKEPLRLILCDADEFEKQKANYIEIGRREAKKRYDRRLAELDKSYEAASKAKDDEYYQRLNELEEELANARKNMDEYADMFARIDESEIDTVAQKAIELFNRGELDEAIRMFEQGNYLEKLRADNRAISQADKMIATANRAKENAESDREKHIESIKAQANAYKLRNDWEKAGSLLKALADELGTYELIAEYAEYCRFQNNFSDAEAYYEKALDIVEEYKDKTTSEYLYRKGSMCNNLGVIFMDVANYDKSKIMLSESLLLYRKLSVNNPNVYSGELAMVLMNFGVLYKELNDYKKSESMYKESLSLYRGLYANNPNSYSIDLATVLMNLGNLYMQANRYEECEPIYRESLSLYRELYSTDSSLYAIDLAKALMNFGSLYGKLGKYEESESMYNESLSLYRKLYANNPDASAKDLAKVLINLGNLYCDLENYEESGLVYKESLSLYRKLYADNPSSYTKDLADALMNLGTLYGRQKNFEECKSMYKESLSLYRKLYANNPIAYAVDLASILMNLGNLYGILSDYEECGLVYKESLSLYRRLYAENPNTYGGDLAEVLMRFGSLYLITADYGESSLMYNESVSLYKSLYKSNPELYKEDYVIAFRGMSCAMSYVSIFKANYEEAERFAREGLAIAPNGNFVQSCLALALLMDGKYSEAEVVYKQYKMKLKDRFLYDFKKLEEANAIPEERKADVERIKQLLAE